MTLAALIFNVDGAFARTDEAHRGAFNRCFGDSGIPWDWTRLVYQSMDEHASPKSKLLKFLENNPIPELDSPDAIERLLADQIAEYRRALESGTAPLRPGVARLVRDARAAGLGLAAITSTPRSDFEHLVINHLGIHALDWFDAVVAPRSGAEPLTLGTAYKRALTSLGSAPEKTVAIEATRPGTRAAKSSGMAVIATPPVFTTAEAFSGADFVLSDLGHPAAPFHVIRGDVRGRHYVSVDALNEWTSAAAIAA